MQFELTQEFIEEIEQLIVSKNSVAVEDHFKEMHPADIAEVLDALNFDEAVFVIRLLDSETTSDILEELEEDTRERVLQSLSVKEIAKEIDELETDAAADIIAELPEERKDQVIAEIEDKDHAKDIVDLMRYEEDSAGGLMGKELVAVKENWTVIRAVREMRKQAEDLEEVYIVFVVDEAGELKGRLSLKSLLRTNDKTLVKDVYVPDIHYVKTTDDADEVAQIMQKYDLFVLPVIDQIGHLVGQITIDDVVDHIRDEADKDYQMAAGITDDVEADDSIKELVKARLPWLIIALLGGFLSVLVLNSFNYAMIKYASLFFFTPLIAATAGNVGVQSSAIVVQGLANGSLKGSVWNRLLKEITLSLLNGFILAIILMLIGHFLLSNYISGFDFAMSLTVAISLISVILIASLIGTFVPIFLDKRGIDPAVATGPFITTSNDIFGIFIFFYIAKLLLGF